MRILLTIDDTPSRAFLRKIEFLHAREIPAVLFCRGDAMSIRLHEIVAAVKKGFIIGNHAFDHPRFSGCSFEQCKDQILRTEALVNRAYELAGVKRPCKLFRFPFGDRGAGETRSKVQTFLREQGFVSIARIMSERLFNFNRESDLGTDSLWSFDVLEYKTMSQYGREKTGLKTTKDVTARIAKYLESRKRFPATEVVLVHDFDRTDYMFQNIITALTAQGIGFINLLSFLTSASTAEVTTTSAAASAALLTAAPGFFPTFSRHPDTSSANRDKRAHEHITSRSDADQEHANKKGRAGTSAMPKVA